MPAAPGGAAGAHPQLCSTGHGALPAAPAERRWMPRSSPGSQLCPGPPLLSLRACLQDAAIGAQDLHWNGHIGPSARGTQGGKEKKQA